MENSVKHREFVGEPMGDKEVTSVAGIGTAYGTRLSDAGYDKADKLLGQFLLLKKDQDRFVEWLKQTSGVNANDGNVAFNCLNEWAEQFI